MATGLRINLLRELNALESLQGEALAQKYERVAGRKPATACAPMALEITLR